MYYTYIVECNDHTLYTGWTTDLKRREKTHNAGKGAKYTRSRLPVKIVYYEGFETKIEAMKREYAIKQLGRKQKLQLIEKKEERTLRVALAQTDIVWEDIEANKIKAEQLCEKAAEEGAELIVFPEMSLTGFSMDVIKFEHEADNQIDFFKEMSKKYHLPVIFGYLTPVSADEYIEGGKNYFNKLAFVKDGEIIMDYAKIHPFTFGLEGKDFRGGDAIRCMSYKDITMGAFICYDLRFPEIFEISSEKSQIIFVIAEWPASRIDQWDKLLMARAIENQSFIVAVNRTGNGGGLKYNGHSAVYSPLGERITEISEEEGIILCDLDPEEVSYIRNRMNLKADRRPDLYRSVKLECL